MCSGSADDGTFRSTAVSEDELERRCAADAACVGVYVRRIRSASYDEVQLRPQMNLNLSQYPRRDVVPNVPGFELRELTCGGRPRAALSPSRKRFDPRSCQYNESQLCSRPGGQLLA